MKGGELRRKAASGVLWAGLESWGANVIGLLVFVVMARLLSQSDVGLVGFANAALALGTLLREQGIGQALIQRQSLTATHLDSAFWFSLVSAVAVGGIAFVVADFLAATVDMPGLGAILQALVAAFALNALSSVPRALMRRQFQFKLMAAINLLAVTVGGIIGIAMAFSGWGPWALVGQITASACINAAGLWLRCGWRPRVSGQWKALRELWSFGLPVLGTDLLQTLSERLPALLIGGYLGPAALGLYEVARRVTTALTQILTSTIAGVAFPAFSRLQSEGSQLRAAFYTCTQVSELIAIPVFAGLLVLAPQLVWLAFGDTWMESVPVLQILAFSGMLASFGAFNAPALKAAGKPHWVLMIAALQLLAGAAVSLAVLMSGGQLESMVTAWVARAYVLAPLGLAALVLAMGLDWRVHLRQLLVPVLVSIVMAASVYGLRAMLPADLHAAAQVTILVPAGVIVYVSVIWLVAPQLIHKVMEIGKLAVTGRTAPAGGSS